MFSRRIFFNSFNKKKNLFLGAHASYVEGLALAEGRVLIAELNQKIVETEFVYSHSWKKDDLVIWDNRCVLHRACPYDVSEPRVLQATRISGDPASELAETGADDRASSFAPSSLNT